MDPVTLSLGVAAVALAGVVVRLSLALRETRRTAATTSDQLSAALQKMAEAHVDLQAAHAEVKSLSGLLPMCAWCKKIRDDAGYWQQLEGYLHTHTDAEFSHSMCPDCSERIQADMPDARWRI